MNAHLVVDFYSIMNANVNYVIEFGMKREGYKMKQAYENKAAGDWPCMSRWVPVETTGRCKKVEGGLHNELYYYQIQRRLFGIPLWKCWILSDYIKWCDPVVETEYGCKCGEQSDE